MAPSRNGSILNARSIVIVIVIFIFGLILPIIVVTLLSHSTKRLNVPLTPNAKRPKLTLTPNLPRPNLTPNVRLNLPRPNLPRPNQRRPNPTPNVRPNPPLPHGVHEYATVNLSNGNFLGASATINVWNPMVRWPEVSFSQIWVTSGSGENINSVEAGVLVDSRSRPINRPRIFVYWTNNSYRTGCYDLQCPGFVLSGSSRFRPGSPLVPVSIYGGRQYQISIAITKDQVTGDWWLRIENEAVGYWSNRLFTSLSGHADKIQWGGEIVNTKPHGRHTRTQMGSGHLPVEGYRKASYFRNLTFVDGSHGRSIETHPASANLQIFVTRPECYDLRLNVDPPNEVGVNFYYGGPGLSAQCAR